jgi:hypothetical protein
MRVTHGLEPFFRAETPVMANEVKQSSHFEEIASLRSQ